LEINHEKTDNGGVISAVHEGKPVAQLKYTRVGPKLFRIDDTRIRDQAKGRGVARKMMQKLVERAREKGAKIQTADDAARKMFEKHEQLHDIWDRG
jgi:predicted GNAT family acetyltransferase